MIDFVKKFVDSTVWIALKDGKKVGELVYKNGTYRLYECTSAPVKIVHFRKTFDEMMQVCEEVFK